jgi:flagellar biosynthetic protein FlhB
MADNKTEKATPRRLHKAREEGQFVVSRMFVASMQFLLFAGLIHSFTASWFTTLRIGFGEFLRNALDPKLAPADVIMLGVNFMRHTLLPVALMGALLIVAGLAMQLGVTGLGISAKLLTPDVKRLNGFAKLGTLPGQNLTAMLQATVMIPVFALAVYSLMNANLESFLRIPLQQLSAGLTLSLSSIDSLLWKAAQLFLVFGIVDLVRAKTKHNKKLRMTKQEVRDEAKEMEGSPEIKMRLRKIRRDLARRNMMKELPKATAVIVNPTHYAVALLYDRNVPGAPRVIAKGKNYLALRIRQRALEYKIPLIENPPLAQGLYKATEVGHEIPAHFYKAVAEVLAYIFRLTNGAKSA